jgi:hypothetical protein
VSLDFDESLDLDYESPELDFMVWADTEFDTFNGLATPKHWVIDAVLPKGLTVLYGPRSAGKSFLAYDWAFSVGTGKSWLGRYDVRQCDVLYINAEGDPEHRVKAWKKHHGFEGKDAHVSFVERGVDLLNKQQLNAFVYWVAKMDRRPRLFILDTLAASMGVGGHNENNPDAMGGFVSNFNKVRKHFNADGIIIHHSGHDAERERGHSSLGASADVIFGLKQVSRNATNAPRVELLLETSKPPRDGRALEPVHLVRQEIDLVGENASRILAATNEDRARAGLPLLTKCPDITSCVIRENLDAQDDAGTASRIDGNAKDEQAWTALASFGEHGARRADWEPISGVTGGSFDRVRQRLEKAGRVVQRGRLYVAIQNQPAKEAA